MSMKGPDGYLSLRAFLRFSMNDVLGKSHQDILGFEIVLKEELVPLFVDFKDV